jgi:hypothetical protein
MKYSNDKRRSALQPEKKKKSVAQQLSLPFFVAVATKIAVRMSPLSRYSFLF